MRVVHLCVIVAETEITNSGFIRDGFYISKFSLKITGKVSEIFVVLVKLKQPWDHRRDFVICFGEFRRVRLILDFGLHLMLHFPSMLHKST